jgi:plasmid maintenance system antidote protein VapI
MYRSQSSIRRRAPPHSDQHGGSGHYPNNRPFRISPRAASATGRAPGRRFYDADPNAAALFDELMTAIGTFGKQEMASRIGISRNSLTKILDVKCQNLSPQIFHKIGSAIAVLNSEASEEMKLLELIRAEVGKIGLSEFARRLQVDAANLSKVTDGKRKLSRNLSSRIEGFRASQVS